MGFAIAQPTYALFDHLVGAARGTRNVERLDRLQLRQVRCIRTTTVVQ